MRDCWSQVPIVEHFTCWLAGVHRDNQGLTAGACPNGRHLSLCSPKNTKTFKSVINSFRPCSGVLTFKSLSTHNLEHWMHKWGLTFWATYSHTINFKTRPANITWNATRTNPDLLLECIGSICTICWWMFVGIYYSPGMGFSDRLPPFAPCDHSSFHQICSSPASSPNLLGKMKSVYKNLINGLDPTTVAYSLFQSSMKCLTTDMK